MYLPETCLQFTSPKYLLALNVSLCICSFSDLVANTAIRSELILVLVLINTNRSGCNENR